MTIEIPKNQSFQDGFWINWKLYNLQNIPAGKISMEVHVGSQTKEINDPIKLSEFIKLNITENRTEVHITITVDNTWNTTKTVVVIIDQPQTPSKN